MRPKQSDSNWQPMPLPSRAFYGVTTIVNANSGCTIVVDGVLDAERLQRAACELTNLHPVLGSVVEKRKGRPGWRRVNQAVGVEEVDFSDRCGSEALEEIVNWTWRFEFRLGEEIPLFIYLFRLSDCNVVQIIHHHVNEDARASYQLTADLARIYGELERGEYVADRVQPRFPRDADAALFKDRKDEPRLREALGALWEATVEFVRRDATFPWPRASAGPRRRTPARRGFIVRTIDPSVFERARRAAKAQGASTHALLVLAMYRLARREIGGQPARIRLGDMFSVRSIVGDDADDIYQNLSLPFVLRLSSDRDKDALARIASSIQRLKRNGHLRLFARFSAFVSMVSRTPARLTYWITQRTIQSKLVMTNPGTVPFDMERIGKHPIREFYSYPQIFPPAVVSWQFSGFRGRVRLIILYDKESLSDEYMTRFVAGYLRELEEVVDGLQSS